MNAEPKLCTPLEYIATLKTYNKQCTVKINYPMGYQTQHVASFIQHGATMHSLGGIYEKAMNVQPNLNTP